MPPTVLRYGFKIFLDHEAQPGAAANGGFIVSTDNLLLPAGVRSNKAAGTLRFEHGVFQLVSGDGDVTLDITQKRLGEEIKFGQVVRLLHVTSNSFLCESRRLRATKEKANQKVLLADFSSEELRGSRWRVAPRYKVRSEGQKICNKDVIVLQSLAGDTMLHVSNSHDTSTDNFYEVNAGLNPSGFKIQIYDMNSAQGEGRELRCGDCIQLLHREERALFVAQPQTAKKFSDLMAQLNLPTHMGASFNGTIRAGAAGQDDIEEDEFYDEVMLEDVPENSVVESDTLNSMSMFVVEADNTFAGGSVTFGNKRYFRLKSLATGRYMCAFRRQGGPGSPAGAAGSDIMSALAGMGVRALGDQAGVGFDASGADDEDDTRRKDDDIDQEMVVVLVKKKSEATMLYFDQAADDASTTARSHSRVFVIFPQNDGRWLSCSNTPPAADGQAPNTLMRRGSSSSLPGMPDATELALRNRKYAATSRHASHKDGIELIKVPRTDFQDLNFVLAQLPPIRRLIKTFAAQRGKPTEQRLALLPSSQLVAQVRENLATLGRLCTSSSEDNVLLREGTPLPKAQNRLVDQNVPQLCLELVEAIFCDPQFITNKNITSIAPIEDDLNAKDEEGNATTGASAGQMPLKYIDVNNLVRTAFRVMRLCLMHNVRTASALSGCIPRIMRFVEQNYGAFEALAELYADNPSVVMADESASQLADTFIDFARQYGRKSGNYVFMLALLSSCRGVGVKTQQGKIGHELLEDDLNLHRREGQLRSDAAYGASPQPKDSTDKGRSMDTAALEAEPLFYRLWVESGVVRIDHGRRFPGQPSGGKKEAAGYDSDDDTSPDAPLGMALEDFCARENMNDNGSRMGSRASFSRDSTAAGGINMGPKLLQSTSPGFVVMRQLHLLTALSRTRNMENIDMVRELLPKDVILAAMRNERLPGDLRAAFIDLLVTIEIDVPPFRDEVEHALRLVRVWDEMPMSGDVKISEYRCATQEAVPGPVVGELKTYLREVFKKHASLDPYNRPMNLCMAASITALKVLARLGLVPNEEFLEWIDTLVPVLDGRDDVEPRITDVYRRKFGEFDRHRYDEENHQLMVCKLHIIDVFDMFAVFARAVMVSRLVINFRRGDDIPHTSTLLDVRCEPYVDDKSKEFIEERESRRKKAEGNFLQMGLGGLTDMAGKGLGGLQSLGGMALSFIPGQSEKKHPLDFFRSLVDVLVDIAQYEYQPLVISSVKLLLSLLNSHRGVLEQLRNVQILGSTKSVKFFEIVSPDVADLERFKEMIILPSDKEHIVRLINGLTKTVVSLAPRPYGSAFSSPSAGQSPSHAMSRDAEQHAILKNLGAHVAVAQLCKTIATHSTGGDPSTGRVKTWVREILTASYEFLESMVRDSKPVAWDLFPFTEVFTRHLPLRLGALDVLQHMFEGNVDLCSSLGDTVIQDLVLAMSVTEYDPRVARVLRLLVWQDGQLIRRNQAQVLKSLIDGDELILRCRDITTGHVGKRIRDKKMAEEEYKDRQSKIMFHLEVITIIACCVTGRNDPTLRAEVRTAMFNSNTLDDIFEVLTSRSLFSFYRLPYIKLFAALYLEDTSLRMQILEHKHFIKFLKATSESILQLASFVDVYNSNPGLYAERVPSPSHEPSAPNTKSSRLFSDEVEMAYLFTGVMPALHKLLNVHLRNLGTDDETASIEATPLVEECGALAAAMSEALADLIQIYPYERPPPELIPGQVPEEEPEPEQSGLFGGLSLNLFSKKKETKEKVKIDWKSQLPARLRTGGDFFFEGDCRGEAFVGAEPRLVPHIPVDYVKEYGAVLDLFIELEFRDKPGTGDENDANDNLGLQSDPSAVVREYISPPVQDDESNDVETLKLFTAWHAFCDKYEDTVEGTVDDTAFRSAAIVILRKSREGHNLVRCMIRIIDNPLLDDFSRISLLLAFRQIVSAEEDDLSDASALIEENDKVKLTQKELDRGIEDWEVEKEILRLDKTQSERQNIFASWAGEARTSLAPKLVIMLSRSSHTLLEAALKCLNALLRDGNAKIQAVIYNWAKEKSDEEFFMVIRSRMVQCREQLRDRRRAIRRDIGDDSRRTERLPASLHARLRRRFSFEIPQLFLELVQLLCEGHFADMQNYFRVQLDNQISINVLEAITNVLEILVKSVDTATIQVTIQTMSTITELLQGPCLENQAFMVSQNIGDIVTKVFTTHYYDVSDEDRWKLRHAAITLCLALMEGHMNLNVIGTLMQSLDLEPLVECMDATYRAWADERGIRDSTNPVEMAVDMVKDLLKGMFMGLGEGNEFEDTLNLSCSIFVFLKTLLDVEQLNIVEAQAGVGTADDYEFMVDKTGKSIKELFRQSKGYKKLSRRIATIEIKRNGRLEKVYFRVPSICVYNLRKESREALIWEVGRDGDGERIGDFYERCFGLIREMEYFEDMRRTPGLSLIQKYDPIFDNLSLLIAFAINLYLLFNVRYENAPYSDEHLLPGQITDGYRGLGIAQMAIQILLFLNFFFGPRKIYLEERWTEFDEFMNRHAVEESKQSLGIEPPKIDPDPKGKLPFFAQFILSTIFLLIWPAFYKRALFVVIAFVGFFYSPVWYCVQMLQIVAKSPLLQNVVRSITSNWKSLLLTGCLLLVTVYIFSIIAYFNFPGYYGTPDTPMGIGGNCDSLIRCMVVNLVYGLKSGGGVSETIGYPVFGGSYDVSAYLRLLFDFCFFLILIIMFLNLVFGIILDTFGQLREEREAIEKDQKGKCFICGQDRSDFDRVVNGGFEQHIEYEQNMWDYLYFMHYVKLKPSEDHNGQEGFVAECMESHEPLFFPIGQAMIIEAHESGEKDELAEEAAEDGPAGHVGGGKQDEGEAVLGQPSQAVFAEDTPRPMGGDDELGPRLARLENMLSQILLNQAHTRQPPTQHIPTGHNAPPRAFQ
jgi:hypothetical protein